MVGCHHQLNGHEFEQAPRDGKGQGSLVCCSSWGGKELDTTGLLNNISMKRNHSILHGSTFPPDISTTGLDALWI